MNGGGPNHVDPGQFREAFIEEATEHLETLEQALLGLEADPLRGELVDEIFRAAHSIKGGAATFGLPEVARFTHSLEGLLDRVRRGVLQPIPGRIALLLRAADVVRSMLVSARGGERSPAPIEAVLAELDRELAAPAITDYAVTFRPPGDLFRRGLQLRQLDHTGRRLPVERLVRRAGLRPLGHRLRLRPERLELSAARRQRLLRRPGLAGAGRRRGPLLPRGRRLHREPERSRRRVGER